jgi:hypothetical protein
MTSKNILSARNRCLLRAVERLSESNRGWIKHEELDSQEARAEELKLIFERKGYTGYLRRDLKDSQGADDHYGAGLELQCW